MPVLRQVRERFTAEQPFRDARIGACLHVTIDRDIARLKLASMGVRIDELTPRQQEYLASWTHGT